MKKILLTLALMVGVLGVTYAEKPEKAERKSKGKKEQAPEINKEEVLQTAAESLTTEILERMKIELKGGKKAFNDYKKALKEDKSNSSTDGKAIYDCFPKNASQFFYATMEEEANFKVVYEALVELTGNTFDPENRTTNVIASKDKETNEDSEDKFDVTTSFDVKTTTAKGLAKYNVTISWKECEVKNGNAKLKSPAVVAKSITYTGNEKSSMKSSALDLVRDALANPKFVSEDDLNITLKKGKIENNPNSLSAELDVKTISTNEYVITPKDNVIITLDPKQYIKGEEYLYDDPSELRYTITFVPVYTIVVSNYGEPAVVKNIEYTKVDPVTPRTKGEREAMFKAAEEVRVNYLNTLNAYLITKDKAARKELNNELLNMFENEKTIVKVTYLPKNGKERVNDIEAKKYLQRIKGESFSFSKPIKELNEEGNAANFTFEQTFKSKYYNDKVTKKITIGEGETGAYVIKGIEVVENSTERIEETK